MSYLYVYSMPNSVVHGSITQGPGGKTNKLVSAAIQQSVRDSNKKPLDIANCGDVRCKTKILVQSQSDSVVMVSLFALLEGTHHSVFRLTYIIFMFTILKLLQIL